jgi:hypothetical protein
MAGKLGGSEAGRRIELIADWGLKKIQIRKRDDALRATRIDE